MNSDHSFDDRPDRGPGGEAIDCARVAEDAIRRLAGLTVDRPSMTPADVDVVLAHLAEAVAALPQVTAQLGDVLDHAKDDYRPTMDSMTGTVDTAIANETAHISAAPHDDELDKSRSPLHDVRRRQPEPHQRPGTGDRRPGPAR